MGTKLRTQLPALGVEVVAPPRVDLDITHAETISKALCCYDPGIIVHTAAYTDVSEAETDREACWKIKVEGTSNVVLVLMGRQAMLIYISTDYVF